MRRLNVIWLCGLLAACGAGPTSPSAVNSAAGSSAERVSALGAPPTSEIGPGPGTGAPPADPYSCSTVSPSLDNNQGNGRIELEVGFVGGNTRGYTFEVYRQTGGLVDRRSTSIDDSAQGRRWQWALVHDPRVRPPSGSLGPGNYLARARADRRGCGALDQGPWSAWSPFSVRDGNPQDAGSVTMPNGD